MSQFPENLSILRRRAGYTQEALAEALGVSRQAVSKWESGQTLPEAATLLTLADLLSCTLDQLMRETLAGDDSPPAEPFADEGQNLYAAFAAHVDRFALMIALGVVLVLTGVGLTTVGATLLGESALAALPLFICLAAATFLFVAAGMARSDFQRSCPQIPPLWDREEEAAFRRLHRTLMAALIAGILVEVALLVAGSALFESSDTILYFLVGGFLVCLGSTVGGIVYLSLLAQKYDVEDFAREYAREQRKREDKTSGVIMLSATGLFLLLGFLCHAWHPGWLVFPLGGILCAIVDKIKQ